MSGPDDLFEEKAPATRRQLPSLLTAPEVAAVLSVSLRTLRRYASQGLLPPIRLGRTLRYREADVLALLNLDPS